MDDLTLFGAPPPVDKPKESAGASLTRRQRELLAAGLHPLTLVLTRPLRLHPEAAPADDEKAPGRRCGNCVHRQVQASYSGRGYPKCNIPGRASHGAATDCRAFWSGCVDHQHAGEVPADAP